MNRRISYWLFWLQPSTTRKKEPDDFLPLTPTLLDRIDIKEYEKQLNNALEGKTCKKINNIAITGSYAVGKSSFLRTFIHHNALYRNTPIISMAKFSTNEPEKDLSAVEPTVPDQKGSEVKSTAETRQHFREQVEIEKSILEQLLYSAKPEKLSLSRFRRLKDPSIFLVITLLLLVISVLMLMPTVWKEIIAPFPKWTKLSLIPLWAAHVYIFLFALYTLPKLISLIRDYSITKFSIQGVDFERQSNRSFLRDNVDEFIYFFDKTKVQLVIFEDIDRLDASQAMTILTHIREVNRLVNLSRNMPIFFVYAVKDDLFKADDRTKFFDLIIPIIPVINSNNAYEKLADALSLELTNLENKNDLSTQLVKDVSLFFGDLRLIYSLANEYKLYKAKLAKNHHLDFNKLFALLAVKTLYPSVYTQLLVNKGPISEVVKLVNSIREGLKADILNKKQLIAGQINQKKDLMAKKQHDLLALFWVYCVKESGANPFPTAIRIGNDVLHIPAAFEPGSEFENFMLGKNEQDVVVFDNRNHQAGRFKRPTSVINDAGLNYEQCLALLELDQKATDEELTELNRMLKEISDFRLKELMKVDSSRNALLTPVADEYAVIKFLLSHGYIGEDYADYTSFFYPGTISQADKIKVQQLKMLNRLSIETLFDKPAEVLDQLQAADLADGRGLIKGLIPELLRPRNKAKLQSVLTRSSSCTNDILVLWKDLSGKEERIALLASVLESNSIMSVSVLKLLQESAEHNEGILRQYIGELLSDLGNNAHLKLKDSDLFCDTVSALESLDGLEHIKCDWFWSTPKIRYYQLRKVAKEPAKNIMRFGQFKIAPVILGALLQHTKANDNSYSFLSYHSILTTYCEEFIQHINNEIVDFLNLLKSTEGWKETPNSAITLFENENLSAGDKLLVGKSTVSSFSQKVIPDECLLDFVRHDMLKVSLDEIYNVHQQLVLIPTYEPFEEHEALAGFVDRHIEKLVSESSELVFGDDFINYLLRLEVTEKTFTKLAGYLTLSIDTLSSLELPANKWQLLSELPSLPFSKELFSVVQSKSSEAAATLLIYEWPSRYDKMNELGLIRHSTLIGVLLSERIGINDKFYVYEAHLDIDFSQFKSLAYSLVEEALKHGLNLPASDSSLITQVKVSNKSETRAKVALHYISNLQGFSDVCELLSSFRVQGLETLSNKPKTVSVSNTTIMKALLSKLQTFGYVGAIRGEDTAKLTGYLKTSMCET